MYTKQTIKLLSKKNVLLHVSDIDHLVCKCIMTQSTHLYNRILIILLVVLKANRISRRN